jgi:glycosyltransferase involved in cell wall biosynthesis
MRLSRPPRRRRPASSGPHVSIVVATHDAARYFRMLVRTLERTREVPYELVVVDNGSSLKTRLYLMWLVRRGHVQRLCLLDGNRFFAEANNIGVEAASRSARYVLLLNSDIVIRDGRWLRDLLAIHERGASALGYQPLGAWPRADGYCFLIDRDLYRRYRLDETYQWWWCISKLQAELLRDGFRVVAVEDHEDVVHHIGAASGGSWLDASGLEVDESTLRDWFAGRHVTVLAQLPRA